MADDASREASVVCVQEMLTDVILSDTEEIAD